MTAGYDNYAVELLELHCGASHLAPAVLLEAPTDLNICVEGVLQVGVPAIVISWVPCHMRNGTQLILNPTNIEPN